MVERVVLSIINLKKTDYNFGTTPKSIVIYDYGVEIEDKKFETIELSHLWTF